MLQPVAVQLPELASETRLQRSVAERTEEQAVPGVEITYFALLHGEEGQLPDVVSSWRRKESNMQWTRAELSGSQRLEKSFRESPKRCGFSWDDAAAKVGPACTKSIDCHRPRASFGDPKKSIPAPWPITQPYTCYKDLPDYGRGKYGNCISRNRRRKSDFYCQQTCRQPWLECDRAACLCTYEDDAWNLSAPIQPYDDTPSAKDLHVKSSKVVKEVKQEYRATPSGLPPCRWKPKKSCTNVTQYECVAGDAQGKCSGTNWFGNTKCHVSCVHVSLLTPVPYYALWRSGNAARPTVQHERHPIYKHDSSKLTLESRGIHLVRSNVLMSQFCRSEANHFVGISLYSPKFEASAMRLVRSCERVGVCCKAMRLPGSVFGPTAPEGSEEFRFRVIAMKPAFILSQLQATALPVVYLDTDLEFHRYPDLFAPGSWPGYDRDVALFNFWGNETRPDTKDRPHIGSAVAFFNTTHLAKKVLEAWAQASLESLTLPLPMIDPPRPPPISPGQAMAFGPNKKAPDDQVLDLLLTEGQWLGRASFGWLPSSYLRLMPSFYRGVDPIIEHDHGSVPGLLKHSKRKPTMPPVHEFELREPHDPANNGRKLRVTPEENQQEVKHDEWVSYNCFHNNVCPELKPGILPAQMKPGGYKPANPKSCIAVSKMVDNNWCQQVCRGQCPTALCRCDYAIFDVPG